MQHGVIISFKSLQMRIPCITMQTVTQVIPTNAHIMETKVIAIMSMTMAIMIKVRPAPLIPIIIIMVKMSGLLLGQLALNQINVVGRLYQPFKYAKICA